MSANAVGMLSLISLLFVFGNLCYYIWSQISFVDFLKIEILGLLGIPVVYIMLPLICFAAALQISGHISNYWDKKKNPEKFRKMEEDARRVEEYPNVVLNGFKSLINPQKILWAQTFDIAIDTNTARTIAAYPTEEQIPSYSEIAIIDISLQSLVNKDLKRNEASIKRGLLGWAFAGPLGGVVGSGMGSGVHAAETITGYELKIYTDNLNNPLHIVQFADKDIAEEWEALFKAIQFKQKSLQS